MKNKTVAVILATLALGSAGTWLSPSKAEDKGAERVPEKAGLALMLKFTDDESKLKPLPANATAEQRLRAALPRPMLLRCEKQSIMKIAAELETLLKIPVLVEEVILEDSLKTALSVTRRGQAAITLLDLLNQLCGELEMGWTFHHGTLILTTQHAAENRLASQTIPVGDLIQPPLLYQHPANLGPYGFDALIQVIQSSVQPSTWKANGGQGNLTPFENSLSITVSNTFPICLEVEALLAELRKNPPPDAWAKVLGPNAPANKTVPLVYRVFLPERIAKSSTETKTVKDEHGKDQKIETTNLSFECTMTIEQLAALLKKVVTPNDWNGEIKIEVVGEMLLINHTRAGHEAVTKQLHDLRLNEPTFKQAGNQETGNQRTGIF